MMDIGRCAAEGTVRNCRMVHKIVLLVHDRTCAADEQQRIAVVQLSHLVRGQQLLATMSSDEFKIGKKITPLNDKGSYFYKFTQILSLPIRTSCCLIIFFER